MKNKRNVLYSLIIMLAEVIYFPVQAQQNSGVQDAVETKDTVAFGLALLTGCIVMIERPLPTLKTSIQAI